MVAINKNEKNLLLERFPNMTFVRTMKQKSKRGRYYCVETPAAMKYLRRIRNGEIKPNKRGGK